MNLEETYKVVQPSIVAFVSKYDSNDLSSDFPTIFGTGFIVDDGLVVTNGHVVEAFSDIPKPSTAPPEEISAEAILFHWVPGEGMGQIPIEILGAFCVDDMQVEGHYYGPRRPDIAFVHVKAKGLPKIEIDSKAVALQAGARVATAGFPMGTDALSAPGWIHQLTPTLQEGIISAVLPFPCDAPHAVMVNIMSQGGASGSPVFSPSAPVAIGVLYGGLDDTESLEGTSTRYTVPTNFSYFVPAYILENVLQRIRKDPQLKLPDDTQTIDAMVANHQRYTEEE